MLDVCVPPALQSTTWLVALEHHMKTSMLHAMETCLQTRLEDGMFCKNCYIMFQSPCC